MQTEQTDDRSSGPCRSRGRRNRCQPKQFKRTATATVTATATTTVPAGGAEGDGDDAEGARDEDEIALTNPKKQRKTKR
eukprot:30869-Pelagococcus_subviridis.AAC.4